MCGRFEAFARGDYQASLPALDPSFEVVGPPDVTGTGTRARGQEEAAAFINQFIGTWADYRMDIGGFRACGDKVVVEAVHSGRGRTSGVAVEESIYTVVTSPPGASCGRRSCGTIPRRSKSRGCRTRRQHPTEAQCRTRTGDPLLTIAARGFPWLAASR